MRVLLLSSLGLVWAASGLAADGFGYGEIGYGNVSQDGLKTLSVSGDETSTDVDEGLYHFNFGWQSSSLPASGVEWGWQGGAGVSWAAPDLKYRLRIDGGAELDVRLSSKMQLLKTWVGPYVALYPSPRLRLDFSAAPALMYMRANTQRAVIPVPDLTDERVIVLGGDEADGAVGGYARVALHWEIDPRTWIGLSVDYMRADFEIERLGEVTLREPAVFLSFAAPMDVW